MAYIYQITNLINGKKYVGKTLKTIEQRWKEHCKDSKKELQQKRPLYNAMNKYGINNFEISQLEEVSVDNINDREIFWIEKLDTYRNGYNATKGGDGKQYADYEAIYKLFLEGKNIKEIHSLLGYDGSTIKKALMNYGITSEERQNRGRKKVAHKVIMLDKNTLELLKEFSSVQEALDFLNKPHSGHIASVCKGQRKTAYGYSWKYEN